MIAVWFSCGVASAVAAKKTIEVYGDEHEIRILNTPIKEEHQDNQRFLKDVEKWLGVKIESVINPKYPNSSCAEIWSKGFMSNRYGAICTLELKKKARYAWELENKAEWHVLGFTLDEKKRFDRFVKTERPNTLPVLIDAKLTKQDCFDIVEKAGLVLPEIYRNGYPNANCIGCVKATSPTYWNLTRKMFPDVFQERAEQSREIGCKLTRVKKKRIFLDELDPNAKGRSLKNFNIECGIFCEEKSKK